MKLSSMEITNFKGIRSLKIDSHGGQNLNIYADNALGKTTILDAFLWLLFDKDSSGAKDFNIKTLDENGQAIPMIDHSVEAVFDMAGTGTSGTVTLKKTYLEKYTKKRGSADRVFDGHVTEYAVNGVPRSKGEYQAFVEDIAPEKLFRMLTLPTFFSEQLPWQERRKLLVEAFSTVTTAEVLANNPDLQPLAALLEKHSDDDLKKMETATRKKINEELNGIPGRIDEANKAIPEQAATGHTEVLARKAQKIAAAIEGLRQQKATVSAGGEMANKQRQLADLDTALIELRNRHAATASSEAGEKLRVESSILDTLQEQESDLYTKISRAKSDLLKQEHLLADLKRENAAIVERWKHQNTLRFVPGGACPTCGQDYPPHLLQQQEADFNRAKASAMEAINKDGEANKRAVGALKEIIAGLHASITDLDAQIGTAKANVVAQQAKIDALKQSMAAIPTVDTLPEYAEIKTKQEAIQAEIVSLRNDIGPALADLAEKITAKETELAETNRAITSIDMADGQRRRIEELKAREKELARMFEASERTLYLIEQFQRAKISALEASINDRFEMVRWKMFDEQINGGMVETCVCTVGGVPYPDLNNAAKIQAGCDIIRTLAKHHHFFPPAWIDNRESITRLPEMEQQVISLIVSEGDKSLRIETVA